MPDLGAFERASPVSLEPITSGRVALSAFPNPFRGRCDVFQTGGAFDGSALELFGTRGRLLARVPAEAPGRWSFAPPASWPNGLYFLRVAGVRRAVVLLR